MNIVRHLCKYPKTFKDLLNISCLGNIVVRTRPIKADM